MNRTLTAFLAMLAAGATTLPAAKNVILMISDGAGYNQWLAASMYEGKVDSTDPTKANQVYNGTDWVEYGCSTHSASMASTPDGIFDSSLVYNPTDVWDESAEAAVEGAGDFAGYNWIKSTYTDSAAAGTALATGQKVYNNSLNWSSFPAGRGTSLKGKTIAEIAHAKGKAVGTISTVQWSHATPASLGGAHNISRNDYVGIANEMLQGDWLTVIMGAGNPDYTDSGEPRTPTESQAKYVGGSATWAALKAGTHTNGWTLVETKAAFEALAEPTLETVLPTKLVGTAQVASTLQQSRSGDGMAAPGVVPFNANVPDLATMSKAALNVLNQDADGFFLHIEGGAIDWAGHARQPGRIIEEQMDFNRAVEAVCAWVEANSSWEDTILIVTADHETGLLLGDDSVNTPYDTLTYNGAGQVPGMFFASGQEGAYSANHTNQLVPVFAKGDNASDFGFHVKGIDPVYGQYVDNTSVFEVMKAAIDPMPAVSGMEDAKNVIILISDGCGYNTWDAASYYEYGALGMQPYNEAGWVEVACSTFMATPYHEGNNSVPSGYVLERNIYNPEIAWDATPAGYVYKNDTTGAFVGYNWLKQTPTDSASAATALATGQKTYNGSINWANWPAETGHSLEGQTLAEYAHSYGKRVGTISSVQWSHATPAGLGGAHNFTRNNYAALANEMLDGGWLDVIMGAGSPDYTDSGEPRSATESTAKYVGGLTTWTALKTDTHSKGWTLVETKAAFEDLATTATPPRKVVGTAQVATTLQQSRSGGSVAHDAFDAAYPMNANVPDLATMSLGALNVLNDGNNHGFFLHIEGGAVDWAGHANQPGRIIEEQVDFNAAVAAVINWVETNSSWDETLVIVTTDHETGMLWGPNSATVAFDPVVNNGKDNMPGMAFNSNSHTNQLVPVFARGPGANLMVNLAVNEDPVYGAYIDNTDIFSVAYNVMRPKFPANPLAENATEYVGGWKANDWLGAFWDGYYPWVYIPNLSADWVYVMPSETDGLDSIWMYASDTGWVWTRSDWFPWVWDNNTEGWVYAY